RGIRILWMIPVIAMIITFNIKIRMKEPVDEVIAEVKKLKTEKSLVYICPDWFDLNFAYYYRQDWFADYHETDIKQNIRRYMTSEHSYPIVDCSRIDTELWKDADQLIFLDAASESTAPGNGILGFLSARSEERAIPFKGTINIYVYRRR